MNLLNIILEGADSTNTQNDSTQEWIRTIRDRTMETAENTTLGEYDYCMKDLSEYAVYLSLVAIIIALITLWVTWVTYKAQIGTQSNTSRISETEQENYLVDLIRHFYRNLVVSKTIEIKMTRKQFQVYPSEEHLQKLKVNLSHIHLNLFFGQEESFRTMSNLYMKLENYNRELDIIQTHFCDPQLSPEVKKRDLETLLFKCNFLTEKIVETLGKIWKEDGKGLAYIGDAQKVVNKAQLVNQRDNADANRWGRLSGNVQRDSNSFFLSTLFGRVPDRPRLSDEERNARTAALKPFFHEGAEDTFWEQFLQDLRIELGRNDRNSQKVFMIAFDKEQQEPDKPNTRRG
ncbi:MAG: hypothetical protein K6C30_09100, partial [Bacteroidaceae bacterium]|nr:hypothetical protein [Bacteroidaceae bacterium]